MRRQLISKKMVAASAFILGLSFYPTEGNAIVKSVGNDAVAVCDNIKEYICLFSA